MARRKALKIVEGMRIGMLTMLCEGGRNQNHDRTWYYLCDCGVGGRRAVSSLRQVNLVKSCGCSRHHPRRHIGLKFTGIKAQDGMYKKGNRWWFRWKGEDMSLVRWLEDPRVTVNSKTIHSRLHAKRAGQEMTWEQLMFDPPDKTRRRKAVKITRAIPTVEEIHDHPHCQVASHDWGMREHIQRRKFHKLARM